MPSSKIFQAVNVEYDHSILKHFNLTVNIDTHTLLLYLFFRIDCVYDEYV